jgi:hypothetical protein
MRPGWTVPAALIAACMAIGCRGMDYDIAEVASPEYLGLAEEHDHEGERAESEPANPYPRYDASFLCVTPEAAGIEIHEETESDDLCLHDAGERNHGTVWFFNQPWAASFIWGKILLHSVILLALAAAVLLISGHSPAHRRRR